MRVAFVWGSFVYAPAYESHIPVLHTGTGPNVHPGNIRYRRIVRRYALQYLAQCKNDDSADLDPPIREFAYSVVREIRERNGRFLQISKDSFLEAPVTACIFKVIHALRHQVELETKTLKKGKQGRLHETTSLPLQLSFGGKCTRDLEEDERSTSESSSLSRESSQNRPKVTANAPSSSESSLKLTSSIASKGTRAALQRFSSMGRGGSQAWRFPLSSSLFRTPEMMGRAMNNAVPSLVIDMVVVLPEVGLPAFSTLSSQQDLMLELATQRRRQELRLARIVESLSDNRNMLHRTMYG